MFFEMNLSCHPPVFCESEHKTGREVRKPPLQSILRRITHELFSERQIWRKLPGGNRAVRRGGHQAGGLLFRPSTFFGSTKNSNRLNRLKSITNAVPQKRNGKDCSPGFCSVPIAGISCTLLPARTLTASKTTMYALATKAVEASVLHTISGKMYCGNWYWNGFGRSMRISAAM